MEKELNVASDTDTAENFDEFEYEVEVDEATGEVIGELPVDLKTLPKGDLSEKYEILMDNYLSRALTANPKDLAPTTKVRLRRLFKAFPEFQVIYEIKEHMRKDFFEANTAEEARAIADREQSKIPSGKIYRPLRTYFKTLNSEEWSKHIYEYFNDPKEHRYSNAALENINSHIKDINRMCRSLTWDILRLKVLYGDISVRKHKKRWTFKQKMANEEKIKNKYISGYLCDPQTALEDFRNTWNNTMREHGVRKRAANLDDENLSFHMVQSFPEELDISDEEVHQCGLELLEKVANHQGIICSHVHSVVDEEGEVHGKCKHNHILFNAYKHLDKIDPEHPEAVKYHDCKETYQMLQIWNDEIAIDHGLPIILEPDPERFYSWYEKDKSQQGQSWKERVRFDVENARQATSNWDEFVKHMEKNGYQVRDGAHVTYMAPDGEHRIRGEKLGTPYTKENLELYWTIRGRVERDIERSIQDNAAPPLWAVELRHGPLSVDVRLGKQGDLHRPVYAMPLKKAERRDDALQSYFNEKELYDIRNADGKVVAAATGKELVDYLQGLDRGENEKWNELQALRQHQDQTHTWHYNEEQRRRLAEEDAKRDKAYTSGFKNSRTKKPYYINYYDENGRRRTELEIIFLLSVTVLENEKGLWDDFIPVEGHENAAIYAPTNWKIQNLMESIHVADEEGIETAEGLDIRVNQVGAEYSRARAALQKTMKAQQRMVTLNDAIDEYNDVKDLV